MALRGGGRRPARLVPVTCDTGQLGGVGGPLLPPRPHNLGQTISPDRNSIEGKNAALHSTRL